MSAYPPQPLVTSDAGSGADEMPPRRSTRHFRRRDALHNYSLHFGPNMTPMVDVVMVILIFFMAFAAFMGNEWFLRAAIPFQAGRGHDSSKPNDPLAPPPTQLKVVLDADAAGNTVVSFLRFNRVSMAEFEQRIGEFPRNEATRNIEVLLIPTARVAYADVVRAHAACDAVGIYKVGYSLAGPNVETPK
ncbi:MAG TPA: biopolymer transporter ExbD [Phycisphaerales bacterium]|nr:biopolymer transporter ExbD [Phycisphaerales bacterium]